MKHLLLTTIAAVLLVEVYAATVSAQQSSNRGLKLFDVELAREKHEPANFEFQR
jgi:hypothetical protein